MRVTFGSYKLVAPPVPFTIPIGFGQRPRTGKPNKPNAAAGKPPKKKRLDVIA